MALLSRDRAGTTATLGKQNKLVKKGDRILVNGLALERKGEGLHPGTVQYAGSVNGHFQPPRTRVGVSLYDNVYSSHNGIYKGKRYFCCPRGHGAMVKYSEIKPLSPVPRTWSLNGNEMYPNYEGIRRRRKLREQKIKEAEENFYREYQSKRRAEMQKSYKPASLLHLSPRSDTKYQTHGKQEHVQSLDEEKLEEVKFRQMVQVFGGDDKARRMALTLKKLKKAYEEGRIYEQGRITALEEKE